MHGSGASEKGPIEKHFETSRDEEGDERQGVRTRQNDPKIGQRNGIHEGSGLLMNNKSLKLDLR